MSIRVRSLIILFIVMTAFIGVIWFGVRPHYERVVLNERKLIMTHYLDYVIKETDRQVVYWIKLISIAEELLKVDPPDFQKSFEKNFEIFPNLNSLRITEMASGEFIEIYPNNTNQIDIDPLWYSEAKPFRFSNDDYYVSWQIELSQLMLYHFFTLSDKEYRVTLLFSDYPLTDVINQALYDQTTSAHIWSSDSLMAGEFPNIQDPLQFLSALTSITEIESEEGTYLLASSPLNSIPFWYSVSTPLATIQTPVNRLFNQSNIIFILGFLSLAVIGWIFLSTYIDRPVKKLVNDISPLQKLDFSNPITATDIPEFHRIVDTVEEIRKKLLHYQRINVEDIITQQQINRVLMNFTIEMVATLDESGTLSTSNKQLEKLCQDIGLSSTPNWDELISHPFIKLKKQDKRQERIKSLKLTHYNHEWVVDTLNEHRYIFDVYRLDVRDELDTFKGSMMIMYDLTAERQNDIKRNEMVSFIMHELKNPLTSIQFGLQLIQESDVDDKTQNLYLGLVNQSAVSMDDLINRFMDVSKLDSRTLDIEKELIDLKEHIERCIAEFLAQLKEKKCEITYTTHNGKSTLMASSNMMDDLIRNLISNAIKYGPENRIIEITTEEFGQGIRFTITDYGYGIPERYREKMFTKFFRIKRTDANPGTGLGLAYVKNVVELHGGTINFKSSEKIGTRFRVWLPYEVNIDTKTGVSST